MIAALGGPSCCVRTEISLGGQQIIVRAIIFKIVFHLSLTLWMIVLTLLIPFSSQRQASDGFRNFARLARWQLAIITGIKLEIRGLENVPKDEAFVFSGKHASTLDAVAVLIAFPNLSALAKKELYSIPFLGQVLKKVGLYAIDRHSGKAHEDTPRIVDKIIEEHRPLIVFPEGTRAREGEKQRKLKSGAYHIQKDGRIQVLTGASNAGYAWPAHKIIMRRCKVIFEIHPPMPTGLDKEAFMAELQSRVVDRSDQLALEYATRTDDKDTA